MSSTDDQQAWFLRSTYPVDFPTHDALTKSRVEFEEFIAGELRCWHDSRISNSSATLEQETDETIMLESESTTADVPEDPEEVDTSGADKESENDESDKDESDIDESSTSDADMARFMKGLLSHNQKPKKGNRMPKMENKIPKVESPMPQMENTMPQMENKMLTDNADGAYRSTTDPLVDLFFELEDVIEGPRLQEILQFAWSNDPLATLKIIFNARSIHLGKSSRRTFYRAAGWLAQNHPHTLVANLAWLSRPVIEKKATKTDKDDDDLVLVESENVDERTKFDTKHGVAHGYWKDLLNILALAVNNKLDVLADPREVLNVEDKSIAQAMKARRTAQSHASQRGTARGARGTKGRNCRGRDENTTSGRPDREAASPSGKPAADPKVLRRETRKRRHDVAVSAFNDNAVYRALHLAVARLFAEQLTADLALLRDKDPKAKRSISLCGKWAPSQDHFHDRHTCIISSIAEIMYPRESLDDVLSTTDDRETFLKHARDHYRKDMSALRMHLEIVERDITAGTFDKIKYDRVPSLAMSTYAGLFIRKDLPKFEEYITRVADGKANIAGATLLPSTLIQRARSEANYRWPATTEEKEALGSKGFLEIKVKELEGKVVDGQWKTLVQRIKDSGTLSSSIAVCDVSGSMSSPRFSDGTCPMDSAIGLSLLVAEVTEPPFGGTFITFSEDPLVQRIALAQGLRQKVERMEKAAWDMNTNFVAIFERLILPMAKNNKLKPDEMVKRVFVFSDMQFDSAESQAVRGSHYRGWSNSYDRIKDSFEDAGYDMPELVFWNLCGGRGATAPKPVTVAEEGTSLVSGYSQAMLKVFLDGGGFEEPEEESDSEDEVVVTKGEGDDVTAESPRKKAKTDPLRTVKKAIGHKAYAMLQVMD